MHDPKRLEIRPHKSKIAYTPALGYPRPLLRVIHTSPISVSERITEIMKSTGRKHRILPGTGYTKSHEKIEGLIETKKPIMGKNPFAIVIDEETQLETYFYLPLGK